MISETSMGDQLQLKFNRAESNSCMLPLLFIFFFCGWWWRCVTSKRTRHAIYLNEFAVPCLMFIWIHFCFFFSLCFQMFIRLVFISLVDRSLYTGTNDDIRIVIFREFRNFKVNPCIKIQNKCWVDFVLLSFDLLWLCMNCLFFSFLFQVSDVFVIVVSECRCFSFIACTLVLLASFPFNVHEFKPIPLLNA